jgi:hypothetical protein
MLAYVCTVGSQVFVGVKGITMTYQDNQNFIAPVKTNGMAIAGFVLSFFVSPLGIIFSAIGLNQIGKDPRQGGKGLAIAGLILGILGTVFWVFWMAAIGSAVNAGMN